MDPYSEILCYYATVYFVIETTHLVRTISLSNNTSVEYCGITLLWIRHYNYTDWQLNLLKWQQALSFRPILIDSLPSESSPIKTLLAGVAPRHERLSKQSLAGLLSWKIGHAVSMWAFWVTGKTSRIKDKQLRHIKGTHVASGGGLCLSLNHV